jgi:hypothetical protein
VFLSITLDFPVIIDEQFSKKLLIVLYGYGNFPDIIREGNRLKWFGKKGAENNILTSRRRISNSRLEKFSK